MSQSFKKIKLPDSPGVYFFKKNREILYIGRATSIHDRVRSYFRDDLLETRSPLIFDMVNKAGTVKFKKTDSVLEAIILEANLIKKYQPRYNTDEKDDKSFNYVVITKEDFPQILVIRGRNLTLQATSYKLQAKFGPFPNSNALREALKFIRKIFPYRDEKCKIGQNRPCFNKHLGLCPGTCTGEISKSEYEKTIKYIIQIFEGKKNSVIRGLEKEMKADIKLEEFEKASIVKRQIFALTHIRDVAFIKKDERNHSNILQNIGMISADKVCRPSISAVKPFPRNTSAGIVSPGDTTETLLEECAPPGTQSIMRPFIPAASGRGILDAPNKKPIRIEAYDVAHLGGKNTRGVMVVMENGELVKKEYKTFIIKDAIAGDDIGALAEMLHRRFKHSEWRFPNVVVVDGGIGQFNTALSIVSKYSKKIEVVSVVKDDKHKAREILGNSKIQKNIVFEINAEAHRFAIGKYRKAERRGFIPF